MESLCKLNGQATLVRLEPGRVVVEIGARQFARTEFVPRHILSSYIASRAESRITASEFVTETMTERFGDIKNWPKEAQDFVHPYAFAKIAAGRRNPT
jgi:hypothetical protein